MSRLKEQYTNEIMEAMMKKFGYKNIMQVPKLEKIVINMGVGEAKEKTLRCCCCRYGNDLRQKKRSKPRQENLLLTLS